MPEQTPYERMRKACMNIVEAAADSVMNGNEPPPNLNDVLEMAKWAALDKERAEKAAEDAVKEAATQALIKKIEEIPLE